jgi:hypothetical protein
MIAVTQPSQFGNELGNLTFIMLVHHFIVNMQAFHITAMKRLPKDFFADFAAWWTSIVHIIQKLAALPSNEEREQSQQTTQSVTIGSLYYWHAPIKMSV